MPIHSENPTRFPAINEQSSRELSLAGNARPNVYKQNVPYEQIWKTPPYNSHKLIQPTIK
jgi:hypothetical protein